MSSGVEISVLRQSRGPKVSAGDLLGVLYSGALVDGDGATFDANYDFNTFSVIPSRQLFTFILGAGQVIQGWDQALAGRRLGEVLDLTIPAELAYGSAGAPPSIPPDASLRFRVELVGAVSAGASKAIYPSYRDLGLTKTVVNQLEVLKVQFGSSKVATNLNDTLTGSASKDLLIGLGGSDLLQGGAAADVLIGGPGSNRFVYTDLGDSSPRRGGQDQILGFQRAADLIDFSALADAITYIGKRGFSGDAAEVRFASGSLQLDADADGSANLELLLPGVNRFSGSNLLL